ncbi:MAG: acyclic terpene utilization AtuA family protein [Hyphomicrobiaceae bacterium]
MGNAEVGKMRIGCGAGFSSDRLEPAIDLAQRGRLDWLIFETIGERTMAFGHRDRRLDSRRGYNPQLAQRMRGVLGPCRAHGTRIVTNMGVANVPAAADLTVSIARELGLAGLKVAAVEGDDVSELVGPQTVLVDHGGRSVAEVGLPVVGANAYLGVEALLPALVDGADVVIAGRVSDPSLSLAPIVHQFGWALDDWERLGRGTLVGHLLECGMQVTGGYFADPGVKDVARLADCGFPLAEVDGDGHATITKLEGTGGLVDRRTVKEQLLYEVHDPSAYLTPDVTADFSRVQVTETGRDRVHLQGGSGRERPRTLKVTVGFDGGFLGEAGVSYAGPNAARRARLARDIVLERLNRHAGFAGKLRIDIIGLASLHATALGAEAEGKAEPEDVRVHAALRSTDRADAETMLWEVESLLCCGPAGGGGYRGQISPSVVTHSALIEREAVATRHRVLVA